MWHDILSSRLPLVMMPRLPTIEDRPKSCSCADATAISWCKRHQCRRDILQLSGIAKSSPAEEICHRLRRFGRFITSSIAMTLTACLLCPASSISRQRSDRRQNTPISSCIRTTSCESIWARAQSLPHLPIRWVKHFWAISKHDRVYPQLSIASVQRPT